MSRKSFWARPPRPRTKKRSRPLPKSRFQRFLLRYGWLLPIGAILIGAAVLLLTYAFASIPLPEDVQLESSAKVFDRDGRLIGTYQDEIRRFIIDTDKLPEFVGQAVVAVEDRDFYEHNGVSLRGIVRAAWANLTGGEIQQGGSTITQQYVKQAVLRDPSRTITRKVREAILAIKLERRYSKDEILGFYLNTIYLGRGAYGIEAAAQTYFDVRARDLSLAEAAYLAGIIPAPERYQPDENQQVARARRDHVLDLMVGEGYIDRAEADEAARRKVKLAPSAREDVSPQPAAYFLEWLRKEYLYPEYGERLYTGGLRIYTTLDLDMQSAAEDAIDAILTESTDPQAALVSMTPEGEVRALVGGRDFTSVEKARGFNYASDPPGREAGSSLKPYTLLTAIEQDISPLSRFSGRSPVTITEPACAGAAGPWTPENYGGSQYGTLTLDQATTNSVNTVYAQLAAEVGPDKIVKTLEKFGFDRDGEREIPEVCSLGLGILDVTPLEQARAYAAFSAGGLLPEVMPIRYIEDREGCIKRYRPGKADCDEVVEPEPEQVVEENSANVLNEILTHVVEGGTATVANIGRPVAGKTGTSGENRNAWFAGSVPQLTTVAWMGYPIQERKVPCVTGSETDCNRKGLMKEAYVPQMTYCSDLELCRPVHGIEVTGGCSTICPARIWADYMRVVTADLPIEDFPPPEDLPDEVINKAPVYVTPTPTKSPKPSAKPSESPEPVFTPTPQPTPTPAPTPTLLPTPTPPREDDDP